MKSTINQLQKSDSHFVSKTIKTILALAFVAIIASCSKDNKTPEVVLAPLQDPLREYLEASGFNQGVMEFKNNNQLEVGYSFAPLVNGKITAIVVKIPDVQAGLRVTIWDKVNATVIRTETLDITSSGVEVIKPITPIELFKDKEYFITMNTNDFYIHEKTNLADVTYPFVVGDIKITSYGFKKLATQTMPTTPYLSQYTGDCSFKFQKLM
jgi:hypothetical protein